MENLRLKTVFVVAVLMCYVHATSGKPSTDDVSALINTVSISHLTSDSSPIYQCIHACYGDTGSVSLFHTCNRECVLNPHKYDNNTASTVQSRQSNAHKS